MGNPALFVLANDISFIPVHTIHAKAKSSFDHEENDMVITHMHTRKSSKVLDQESAALLKAFEKPQTWAEAIFRFSVTNKKDPQQLAEQALELLMEMQEEGFLIPYNEGDTKATEALLHINDRFRQYIIKEKLQFFDDSEVYLVEDGERNKYVLKLLKNDKNKKVSFMFRNEINILKKLDGRASPMLKEEGTEERFSYLIIEWIDGVASDSKAARFRNLSIRNNVISMLDMCIAILRAYDHLHKQGILHADIHPKNILISENGICKIIDFGVSVSPENNKRMERGGVGFYFEPEYAQAILNKTKLPASTEKAEQYSIAALLYYLISGHYYVDFSIEREKLFQQILYDNPISFSESDLNLPAELDTIFSVALSKDPVKRFASITDFANAIIEVRNSIYSSADFFIAGKENASDQFIHFMIAKFGWDSLFVRKGLSLSPNCSVNYGSAGIAYMYYRLACLREESPLLDLADVWANHAAGYVADYDRGFYSAEMELTEKSIGSRSVSHSPTGVHLVQALISQCRGDAHAVSIAIQHFLAAAKKPCDQVDVALGKSGLLIGCSILLNELSTTSGSHFTSIKMFANSIMDELWNELDKCADITQPNALNYFGVAHGWGGLLYATLLWCRSSAEHLPANFLKRVGELQSLSFTNKETARWPLSNTDKNSWTGWCNGSAGHVFLWSLLYRHFNEEKYISIAMRTANHIMISPDNNLNNLCCGMAGEAYAFLNLYNLTNEKKYLHQSQNARQKIMNQIELPPLRSNSLYKGDIGLAVLFCEMEKPAFARMPFFE
jgi:eukaryotic-like serine/threonine-protein kinase